MKKIAILSILFSFSLILSDCGDPSDDPKPTPTELEQIQAKIVGAIGISSLLLLRKGRKQQQLFESA
jgi:hypothetical protein